MLIKRNSYLQELSKYKDKNLIKVLTGMRRCGKSTLLDLYANQLRYGGVEDNRIQFINFENPLQYSGNGWRQVFDQIIKNLDEEKMNYIFLDEPQELQEFERLLDGLYLQKNVDLYITGSNSRMLSSDLATLLTGRQIEIHVLPFSFLEFLDFNGIDKTSRNFNFSIPFAKFLQFGGLPGMLELSDEGDEPMINYVKSVFSSITQRDIFVKHRVNYPQSFDNLVRYLSQNIGSLTSPNNIANVYKNDGLKIDRATVETYINYLNESYLFYCVGRFDIKGKRQLVTLEKNYLVDLGFRNVLLGKFPDADTGHILENVIYLELLRRGYRVWVGKVNDKEIDFVAKKNGEIEYYQIAWTVTSQETFMREINPFDSIKDHYPKILITTDEITKSINGIKHYNAIDWLLGAS